MHGTWKKERKTEGVENSRTPLCEIPSPRAYLQPLGAAAGKLADYSLPFHWFILLNTRCLLATPLVGVLWLRGACSRGYMRTGRIRISPGRETRDEKESARTTPGDCCTSEILGQFLGLPFVGRTAVRAGNYLSGLQMLKGAKSEAKEMEIGHQR